LRTRSGTIARKAINLRDFLYREIDEPDGDDELTGLTVTRKGRGSVNNQPLLIILDSASELALADANTQVVIDSEGVGYRVAPEDVFARYDPETVRRALRESRGAFRDVDTEALLADLAEQREQDSIGRPA
jgi:riboflavin biosynthesis pyrimidine reductase